MASDRATADPAMARGTDARGAGAIGTGRWVARAAAMLRSEAAARVSALLGAGVALSSLLLVLRLHRTVPLADQWDNLVTGRDLSLAWLVAEHNEHRLPAARLIFIADAWLTRETFALDLAVGLLMQVVSAALLLALARPARGWDRASLSLAWGLVLALAFSAVQQENFLWGFQVSVLGVCCAALAGFAVAACATSDRVALLGSLVLGALAAAMLSNGLAVPVILVGVASAAGRPRRHIVALALAALIEAAAYLHDYLLPPNAAPPLAGLSLVRIPAYALAELGGPFVGATGPTDVGLAIIVGLFGAGLLGLTLLRLRREPPGATQRRQIALAAMACFVGITAVLTAFGRQHFGLAQAFASRYATPVLLFWLALLLPPLLRRPPNERALAVAAALALTFGFTAAQAPLMLRAQKQQAFFDAAEPAILAGVRDAALLQRLAFDPDLILARAAALRTAGTALFAPAWTRLTDLPRPAALPPCPAADVEWIRVADAPAAWRVTGRLPAAPGPRPRLVLTDGAGAVRGFGRGAFPGKAVGRAAPRAGRDWWIGAARAEDPAELTAVLLGPDDRPACRIDPSAAPPIPSHDVATGFTD